MSKPDHASKNNGGREIRLRAAETKFVVEPSLAETIRAWAREQLSADPHGSGEFGDQYRTVSVYFDTGAYDVFYRRGSFARSKYRARRYGQGDVVFLERKLTRPGLVTKRRTRVDPLDIEVREPASSPSEWFHRRLEARGLKPVCQVSYWRTARVAMTEKGPIRLTLDEDVRALPAAGWSFTAGIREIGTPVMPGAVILELKYPGEMPPIFRGLVDQFGLVPRAASKYRLGVVALGYAPASAMHATTS